MYVFFQAPRFKPNIQFLDWGLTDHDLQLLILGNLGLRTCPQAGKKGQVPTRVLVQPQGKPGLLVSSQVSFRTRSSSSSSSCSSSSCCSFCSSSSFQSA